MSIHPRKSFLYAFVAVLVLFGLLRRGPPSFSFRFRDADKYTPPSEWANRAERVKKAFAHAYHGYERYAMPQDELRPLTNEGMSGYNGWGVTVFDSLDTMLLLGLKDEYRRALKFVEATNFTVVQGKYYVPYFETVIRYLGGMLSAYALTKDPMLLRRAEELADILDPVFESPSGLAAFSVDPISRSHHNKGNTVILSEFATFQLEYTYLAKVSGKKKYYDRVNILNEIFASANLSQTGGMLPSRWDITTGRPMSTSNSVSVGAASDSTHEYLLKQYLLTGMKDKLNLEIYLRTTTYILSDLLYLTPNRGLLYVTDADVPDNGGRMGIRTHVFEHLSCFLPGLLALGAHALPLNDLASIGIDFATLWDHPQYNSTRNSYQVMRQYDLKQLHLWAAEGLAQTCWLTYADQPSGLGPEEVIMARPESQKSGDSGRWMEGMERWRESGAEVTAVPGVSDKGAMTPDRRDYRIRKPGYLLRPETVESLYILWRTTGNVKWRVRGWEIFEAIDRETKTQSGYVTLRDVESSPATQGNSMPSFFLAETLKYLYLLFREDDLLPLDKWVFNTEAHPVPVFEWTADERRLFNVIGGHLI